MTTVLSPQIIDVEVAAFDGKTLLRELLICPGSAEEKAVRYLLRAAEGRLPIATTEPGVTLRTGWSVFALLDVEVVWELNGAETAWVPLTSVKGGIGRCSRQAPSGPTKAPNGSSCSATASSWLLKPSPEVESKRSWPSRLTPVSQFA